jgi:hypothetical protein
VAGHEVYFSIVDAVNKGRLQEPFTRNDFKRACPGFAENTYRNFLYKHAKGNPDTKLFEKVARGKYKLIRPFKYDAREQLRRRCGRN